MARPPRFSGDLPKVKADWQWSGEWPVTTDAVLTGAWRLPAEKRVLLLFANVSDAAVKVPFRLDPGAYGLKDHRLNRAVSQDGWKPSEASPVSKAIVEEIELAAQSVLTWELTPAR
jgi:hypothetical protein